MPVTIEVDPGSGPAIITPGPDGVATDPDGAVRVALENGFLAHVTPG